MKRFSSNGRQPKTGSHRDAQPGLSVIAADMSIEGELRSTGVIRILGKVNGNLHVDGQVIVAQGGLVQGDIHAREAVIASEVQGSIVGDERVELLATALVRGDLTAPKLQVQEGGQVVGRLRVGGSQATRLELCTEEITFPTVGRAPRLEPVSAVG